MHSVSTILSYGNAKGDAKPLSVKLSMAGSMSESSTTRPVRQEAQRSGNPSLVPSFPSGSLPKISFEYTEIGRSSFVDASEAEGDAHISGQVKLEKASADPSLRFQTRK